MSDANTLKELNDVICGIYESHSDRPTISPAWLATEAMVVIKFPRPLHPLGYLACHLQCRQIARAFCRKHFDRDQDDVDDLFQGTLQQRYPRRLTEEGEDPEYVLLEQLEAYDIKFNIQRLRKKAIATVKHADALEAYFLRKFGRAA